MPVPNNFIALADPNQPWKASASRLTAAAMNAMNTFDNPATVEPAPLTRIRNAGSQLTVTIPAKAVVMLELKQNTGCRMSRKGEL
jgi:alpha-N-arabinofuranosidase